ncbi:MAG: hypothetical protein ACRD0P_01480 [Stackebrandtia sp.]
MSYEPPPIYPRHVMCFLGTGLDLEHCRKVAAEVGGEEFTLDDEYSDTEADPNMPQAFESSLTVDSFTDSDWAAVDQHDSVAYILSPPMRPSTQIDNSRRMLAVTAALLRDGASAAKNESSLHAHGRDRWLDLADAAAKAEDEVSLLETLYHAFVKRPIHDGEVLFSCGMQLLGEADIELLDDDLTNADRLVERVELMDAFGIYLLTEETARELEDGSGFRQQPEAPRWLVHQQRDDRNEFEDISFNLAGFWRLSPDTE